MTPSQKLLWNILPHLAHERWSEATHEILTFLRRGEDWSDLLQEAGRHRLLGYLVELIRRCKEAPEPAATWASSFFEQMRARRGLQAQQRDELQGTLSGLPYCFLKGSVLADLHPFPAARIVGDIDLLVPPRALLASLERLTEAGYTFQEPRPFAWPPPNWMRTRGEDLTFDEISLVQRGLLVEVHTNLVSHKLPHLLDVNEVLQEGETELPPEETWIHLLINHHMHRFSGGLGSLLDIALWERKKRPDLHRIRRMINGWQVGYLVDPPLSHLASAFPNLLSILEWKPSPVDPEAILLAPTKAHTETVTPWYWIRQSPKPLATLIRNIFLSRTEAALRYRRDPSDPTLWLLRTLRPFELFVRHLGLF